MSDIQESLITAIYNRLIADTTLQGYVGSRIYHVWAETDTVFPYLVHRLELRRDGEFNVEPAGTYLIDIWSDSPNAKQALDIKARIMALLDNYTATTAETSNYRIWWQTDTFVPESAPDIWHLAMQFNLKYIKDAEIGVTLYR